MPWIRRVVNVDRPLVAVLCDDAWRYLVKRVTALCATGLKVRSVAGDHGSGFAVIVKKAEKPPVPEPDGNAPDSD
ncbi:MAG: hypothetical protein EBR82_74230 [Caulobacteraceae bacterium]|nr:hypothetical protein [Caulobacteraceae bacterium]